MKKRFEDITWDVIVLSPHLDDAVLSLGEHLLRWKREKKKILIITIMSRFVGSKKINDYSKKYLELSGFKTVKSFEKARKREDLRVMKKMKIRGQYLNLLDAGFWEGRKGERYQSKSELLGVVIKREHEKEMEKIEFDLLRTKKILVPFGVGGHVDHLLVKDLSLRWRGVEKGYYLEMPYMLENFNLFRYFKEIIKAKSIMLPTKNKDELLKIYKSQYPLWKKINLYFEVII